MDAGKWIARDRGSEDELPVEIPVPPAMFPLADRLTPFELVMLYSFREGLRECRA